MTFGQKIIIVWVLASAIAGIVVAPTSGRLARAGAASRRNGAVAVLVGIVAAALIVVGTVSHTLNIHVVQIAPLVLALIVIRLEPESGVVAAASLFAFWLLVMGGIWLFLLGIARIFTGTFSVTEIVLTVIIGAASGAGVVAAFRPVSRRSAPTRLATAIAFCALQSAALWFSYQPIITGR